ncbi:hypothetical protein K4K59_011517 [Colletotrichum sp. SAR11_240]|nr:hypothetical protein K4K59_011517 [Colletotrichum sp. SAR11_240]
MSLFTTVSDYDTASALLRLNELLSLRPDHPQKASIPASFHRLHLAWWNARLHDNEALDWPEFVCQNITELSVTLTLVFDTHIPTAFTHKPDVVSRFHNAATALQLTPHAMFLWLGRDVPTKAASTKLISSLVNGRSTSFDKSTVLAAIRQATNERHNDNLLPPEPSTIDVTKAAKALRETQAAAEQAEDPEMGRNTQTDATTAMSFVEPPQPLELPQSPEPSVSIDPITDDAPLQATSFAFDDFQESSSVLDTINDVDMTEAPATIAVTVATDGTMSFQYEGLDAETARFIALVLELSKSDVPARLAVPGTYASSFAATAAAHAAVETYINSGIRITIRDERA